ncbi:hypothetical protein ACMFMG_000893 [Clarireedia jacksonii]
MRLLAFAAAVLSSLPFTTHAQISIQPFLDSSGNPIDANNNAPVNPPPAPPVPATTSSPPPIIAIPTTTPIAVAAATSRATSTTTTQITSVVTVLRASSSSGLGGRLGYGEGKGNATLSVKGTACATGHGGSAHGGGTGASILPILTGGAERAGRVEGKVCAFLCFLCCVCVCVF